LIQDLPLMTAAEKMSDPPYPTWYVENLRSRKEYLEAKDIQVCSLKDLYGDNTGSFAEPEYVGLLCDVFRSVRNINTGQRMGMPVLYYRANTSKLLHDANEPDNPDNIYNYLDNHYLLELGLPWETATKPPLFQVGSDPEGRVFYENTLDRSASIARPYNKDSYILISAGWDGTYGSRDDIYNFRK